MFSVERKAALLEQFGAEYSDLCELGLRIGPEALDAVFDVFGSRKIHVPTEDSFWRALGREVRDRKIRTAFNGSNYDELAWDYSLTPRQIRTIVSKAERPTKPLVVMRNTVKVDQDAYSSLREYARKMDLSMADAATRLIQGAVVRS